MSQYTVQSLTVTNVFLLAIVLQRELGENISCVLCHEPHRVNIISLVKHKQNHSQKSIECRPMWDNQKSYWPAISAPALIVGATSLLVQSSPSSCHRHNIFVAVGLNRHA